jgi:hypothetical protein
MNARPTNRWMQSVAAGCIFLYCIILLVNPPQCAPTFLHSVIRSTQSAVVRLLHDGITAVLWEPVTRELTNAVYFLVIAGMVPLILSRIAGRRLYDLGWRGPNRLALRYCMLALIVAMPFLIWMVGSPTIARPYLKELERMGFLAFALFYSINMFTEHLLLHGVVLGLARPDGRWPDPWPLPPPAKGFVGVLRWLGLANDAPWHHPLEDRRLPNICVWLGLAPGCLMPILFSTFLFGMVHLGKDTRELALAFPGGLAQAYIAYRSNSWFTPLLIHLCTASAALLMMIWMQ